MFSFGGNLPKLTPRVDNARNRVNPLFLRVRDYIYNTCDLNRDINVDVPRLSVCVLFFSVVSLDSKKLTVISVGDRSRSKTVPYDKRRKQTAFFCSKKYYNFIQCVCSINAQLSTYNMNDSFPHSPHSCEIVMLNCTQYIISIYYIM